MSWTWTYGSDTDVISRIHYKYSGAAPGSTNLTTWCNTAFTNYQAATAANFHSSVTLKLIEAVDLTSPTAGTGAHAGTQAGSRSGAALPASTAALLNFTIARRYRGGKMRMYLPMGVAADIASPQTWTNAALTSFSSWFSYLDGIATSLPGGGAIQGNCQVSYYKGSTASISGTAPYERGHTKATIGPAPTYPIVDVIVSRAFSPTPANQRRRDRPG